jgi:hypothetical protein
MTITVSADYDITPARLWELLEPIERHVEWMADAESIDFTSAQRRGVGTRFICVTKVGPIRMRDRMSITVWEPEQRMGVRHEGLVTGSGVFVLEPIDGGRRTRFTWTEELTPRWWLGGSLGERLVLRHVLGWIWRRNLKRLRRVAERSR